MKKWKLIKIKNLKKNSSGKAHLINYYRKIILMH